MDENTKVRILAIVKLLNEVEVKGHENLVRVATAINELKHIAENKEKTVE